MTEFFDTHAHLNSTAFDADRPAVLERARQAGIRRLVTIATDLEDSRHNVALARQHPDVFAVVGWHPGDAEDAPDDFRKELRELVHQPKVVAIGECGLDFYRLPTRMGTGTAADDARVKERQARVFQQQLEVAAELGRNVVIHTRDSFPETLQQFRPFADRVRAVFHCFVGTPAEMNEVLKLGSLVSFTGIATFKNGAGVRETLAATPMDRFMLETDCPYLAPMPYRGQRCEPAYIRNLAEVVAEVKSCSLETLAEVTGATARDFFRGLV